MPDAEPKGYGYESAATFAILKRATDKDNFRVIVDGKYYVKNTFTLPAKGAGCEFWIYEFWMR